MRCLRPRSIQSHSSRAHDARNQVEGENAFGAGGVAIDVEGDAHLQQQAFGGPLALQQLAFFERFDGVQQQARFGTHHSGVVEHLVPEPLGLISIKPHLRTSSLRSARGHPALTAGKQEAGRG